MHLKSALNLNVKQDIHALAELFLNISLWRAVGVGYILCMLKELVVFDHLAEFIEIYKEVLLAVDLTGTRLPRRCGNGKTYVVSPLQSL